MSNTANNGTPKERFCGKPGRSGAPKGNSNAARHYLRAGKLPDKLQYVEHRLNGFRRHIEQLVVVAKGEISLADAALINAAIKWEKVSILCQHYLRHKDEELSVDKILEYNERAAKASDKRNAHLEKLDLDVQRNVWDVIDASHTNTNGQTETE